MEKAIHYSGEENRYELLSSTVDLISKVFECPIAGVSFDNGQEIRLAHAKGITCSVEIPKEKAICRYTLESNGLIHIQDTLLDSRTDNNDLVISHPFMASYLGAPFEINGQKAGCLFIGDTKVRKFNLQQQELFKIFTRQLQENLNQRILLKQYKQDEIDRLESFKHFIHDLKIPISIVRTSLHMMKGKLNSANQDKGKSQHLMERCEQSLKRVFLTIDEVLSSQKLKSTKAQDELDEFNLRSSIYYCLENMEGLIGPNQMIKANIDNFKICWSQEILKRIIENLISNSIKYGRGSDIEIDTLRDEEFLLIRVSDQGIGVSDHIKDKIFEYGFKKGSHLMPSHGIGLHFCKKAAQAFGGDVCVEDNEPKGARFILRIPLTIKKTSSYSLVS